MGHCGPTPSDLAAATINANHVLCILIILSSSPSNTVHHGSRSKRSRKAIHGFLLPDFLFGSSGPWNSLCAQTHNSNFLRSSLIASLLSANTPCSRSRARRSRVARPSLRNWWYEPNFANQMMPTSDFPQGLPFQKVQHKVTTIDAQPSSPTVASLLVSVTGLLLVRPIFKLLDLCFYTWFC